MPTATEQPPQVSKISLLVSDVPECPLQPRVLGSLTCLSVGSHMESFRHRYTSLPRAHRYSTQDLAPPLLGRCMGFACPSYPSRPGPGSDCFDTFDVSGPQCRSGR